MHIVLKHSIVAGNPHELVKGQHTYFGILEHDSLTLVPLITDAVDADNVTRHVIAGDLLLAIFSQQHRLARSGPNAVQSRKAVAGTIQASPLRSRRTVTKSSTGDRSEADSPTGTTLRLAG